jgi:hypothetical protein
MSEPIFKTGQVWVHPDFGKILILEHAIKPDGWRFRCRGISGDYLNNLSVDGDYWYRSASDTILDESSTVREILSKY